MFHDLFLMRIQVRFFLRILWLNTSIYIFYFRVFHSILQKTVLKVNIHCQKCKKEVLKAVTKLTGKYMVGKKSNENLVAMTGLDNNDRECCYSG